MAPPAHSSRCSWSSSPHKPPFTSLAFPAPPSHASPLLPHKAITVGMISEDWNKGEGGKSSMFRSTQHWAMCKIGSSHLAVCPMNVQRLLCKETRSKEKHCIRLDTVVSIGYSGVSSPLSHSYHCGNCMCMYTVYTVYTVTQCTLCTLWLLLNALKLPQLTFPSISCMHCIQVYHAHIHRGTGEEDLLVDRNYQQDLGTTYCSQHKSPKNVKTILGLTMVWRYRVWVTWVTWINTVNMGKQW